MNKQPPTTVQGIKPGASYIWDKHSTTTFPAPIFLPKYSKTQYEKWILAWTCLKDFVYRLGKHTQAYCIILYCSGSRCPDALQWKGCMVCPHAILPLNLLLFRLATLAPPWLQSVLTLTYSGMFFYRSLFKYLWALPCPSDIKLQPLTLQFLCALAGVYIHTEPIKGRLCPVFLLLCSWHSGQFLDHSRDLRCKY